MTYRRPARPSGQALGVARELATQRLAEARARHDATNDALEELVARARAVQAEHEEAVQRADDERTRALRLAMSRVPSDAVPERLRESVRIDARRNQLSRALDGRAAERPERPIQSVEEALAALSSARTERAKVYARFARELEAARREVVESARLLREAEADAERLAG